MRSPQRQQDVVGLYAADNPVPKGCDDVCRRLPMRRRCATSSEGCHFRRSTAWVSSDPMGCDDEVVRILTPTFRHRRPRSATIRGAVLLNQIADAALQQSPDKRAIVCGNRPLTYSMFVPAADHLATDL